MLRWLWKNSVFGISDEELKTLRASGINLDYYIEKYNVDIWVIGISILIFGIYVVITCGF
jgi:hypothetical protein